MTSFKKAFAAARKSGKKQFTWNGKRYNTKLKSDTKSSAPAKSKRPKARPSTKSSPRPKARSYEKGKVKESTPKKAKSKPVRTEMGMSKFGAAMLARREGRKPSGVLAKKSAGKKGRNAPRRKKN